MPWKIEVPLKLSMQYPLSEFEAVGSAYDQLSIAGIRASVMLRSEKTGCALMLTSERKS